MNPVGNSGNLTALIPRAREKIRCLKNTTFPNPEGSYGFRWFPMVSDVSDKNGGKLPFRTGNLIEGRLPSEPRTEALEFPSASECRV
jgi:hypothetical protein